jgi:hypothetical protein
MKKVVFLLNKNKQYSLGKLVFAQGSCDVCNEKAVWFADYGKTNLKARGLTIELCENCLQTLKENEKTEG